MSTTSPFADLDAHQKLMSELQKGADAVMNAADQVNKALDTLDNHNNDITSHPDLRRDVQELQRQVSGNVDERIQEHNSSEVAHPAMMAKIEKMLSESSEVETLINRKVSEHNESPTAHSDIRAQIDGIENQLRDVDLTEVTERIEKLENDCVDVQKNIVDLQSVDAKHDDLIAKNSTRISDIHTNLTMLEEDIRSVASTDIIQGAADMNTIQQVVQDVVSKLGLKEYNPDGPSLINFECDIPSYVGKNATVKFHLTGAQSVNPNNNPVEYTIQQGKGDYIISPTEHITDGQELTMVVGTNGNAGDTMYFVVTATDKVKNTSAATAVGTMMARPVEITRVSLQNLPSNVEPGSSYNVTIRNLADDGERYTYSFDGKATGLIFTPPSDIKVTDTIKITVPATAPRDTDVQFDLVVHDKFSDTQTRTFTVHTNTIPGAEDFTCNLPASVVPGQSLFIRFSGIRGVDGSSSTYNIESNNQLLQFSKTEGILANENVQLTVSPDVTRGEEYQFDVTAITNDGSKVVIPLKFLVNTPPETAGITTTLPQEYQGGKTVEFTISGATDAETPDGITYTINPLSSEFVFSRVSGIPAHTPVSVRIPRVAQDTAKTFEIKAVDSYGEISPTGKQISMIVNPVFVADQPSIIYPKDGDLIEVNFTMKWSEFTKHVEMSN